MSPFSTPALAVLDSVRLVLFVAGFALVGAYLRLRWPDTRDLPERARVVGLALALFVLAGSRATNLGDPELVWQLPASAVVFVLVGYSVLARRRTR